MKEECNYLTIEQVMLEICKCNDEAATSVIFAKGEGSYWRQAIRELKERFSIGSRANKMLRRLPEEFLRQPQGGF